MSIRSFVDEHYRTYPAPSLEQPVAVDHLENGGRLFLTLAGAMRRQKSAVVWPR